MVSGSYGKWLVQRVVIVSGLHGEQFSTSAVPYGTSLALVASRPPASFIGGVYLPIARLK